MWTSDNRGRRVIRLPGTLMRSRHAEFDFTSARIALSKATICSRSRRQATSIGRTISATSERSSTGLDPYTGVIPCMPADQNGDLFWNRGALTPPKSVAGIVDDENGRHLLRNVQSNKMGHRSTSDSANHRATPPGPRHYLRRAARTRVCKHS